MNKAVMLSIRPEWCSKIAFGEKTVEVRKTRPKIDQPFHCFIYETKARMKINRGGWYLWYVGHGAVIGEFVCDMVLDIFVEIPDELQKSYPLPCTGMTDRELMDYLGKGKLGYGWHISDLVIYDTPRPLSDFGLKRPPQSWCYVREK